MSADAERDRVVADPFMTDSFAAMWDDYTEADWQLVKDPTTFLEQCEDAGLAECVEVDDDALDDAFAAERGIEPGGMMWRLTDAGRARYALSRNAHRAP